MKKFFLLFFLLISFNAFNQEVQAYRVLTVSKQVPTVVKTKFNEKYPNALLKNWYISHVTYWQNDVSAGWYTDWYGNRTVVVMRFDKPNFYEVEFAEEPGELSRALFNKEGYWYETRTEVKGLPKNIIDSLQTSEFSNWKISKFIERTESAAWSKAIYRFKVSKGMKSRLLKVTEQGQIFQVREL